MERIRSARLVAAGAVMFGLGLSGCVAPTTMRSEVDPAAAVREASLQRKMKVERQYKDQLRVQNVARPILVASAELCGERVFPSTGLVVANAHDFKGEYHQAAREYGLGDALTVVAVLKGSPAEAAGLQTWDVLTEIDGAPAPSGKKATVTFVERSRAALKDDGRIGVRVLRSGAPLEVQLVGEPACDFGVLVDSSDDAVNAYADGRNVIITGGMLRFVENDQELALVVGHELAHNAMGHISAQSVNRAIGTVFDVLAAAYGVNTQGAFGDATARAYSQEFEAEADYVGLYALARAGIPTEGAADFWRRFGMATGNIKTVYGSSHPGSAERFLALEGASGEIVRKRDAGEALVPNVKSKK